MNHWKWRNIYGYNENHINSTVDNNNDISLSIMPQYEKYFFSKVIIQTKFIKGIPKLWCTWYDVGLVVSNATVERRQSFVVESLTFEENTTLLKRNKNYQIKRKNLFRYIISKSTVTKFGNNSPCHNSKTNKAKVIILVSQIKNKCHFLDLRKVITLHNRQFSL